MPVRGAWRETALGVGVSLVGSLVVRALGIVRDDGSAFLLGLLLMGAYAVGLLAMRGAIARYYRDVLAFAHASSDMPVQHRRITLDEDGITTESAAGTGRWRWGGLTESEEAEGLLLFHIGHVHGFAIPVRAFAAPEEARAALTFARERIAAARAT